MFTGIVEEIGVVKALERNDGAVTLRIGAERVLEDAVQGDSVAVDGACLTVTGRGQDWFEVGLSPETLRLTNLGERVAGDRLNLERAVAVGSRMGGHFVQGHVDGVGAVLSRRVEGDSLLVTFSVPPPLMKYIVAKGFVAVDGVSLTVIRRRRSDFSVALVAYTRHATGLAQKAMGKSVNLEVDVVAKYVENLLQLAPRTGRRDEAERNG